MRKFKPTVTAAILLLFGAAGCADLEVTNPNDPTREQALTSANDIESLIAGSFNTWFTGLYYLNQNWLSAASFQHSSTAANFGVIDMSTFPRPAVINDPAYADYGLVVERSWTRAYRALAAVGDGIRSLDETPEFGETLDDREEAGGEERIRALGRTTQALAHATIAVLYDQGYVIDETKDVNEDQTIVSRDEMWQAALGYFDDAIALAEAGSGEWEIPAEWMSVPVTAEQLVELLHSWRAIYRASMPRTPDEMTAADWQLVLDDLDAGLTETWYMDNDYVNRNWYNGAIDYITGPGSWGFVNYFILGMADQSGNYQQWLDVPLNDRTAWFGGQQDEDPFLIITPDQRFPQGSTIEEQAASSGTYLDPGSEFVLPTGDNWLYSRSENFTNPGRGTWRWSYYWWAGNFWYWYQVEFELPHITIDELNLLRAEALLATDDPEGAATLINETRTAAGLNATDASGTNTDCVPKLPEGTCGDLMEMLKWEKRIETYATGLFANSWFFDGRRWGDHYVGTPLQLPVPAVDQVVLGLDRYTLGGVGDAPPNASAGSSYEWPSEDN